MIWTIITLTKLPIVMLACHHLTIYHSIICDCTPSSKETDPESAVGELAVKGNPYADWETSKTHI